MSEFNGDIFVTGKCKQMCPKEEILMRQQNELIHVLETKNTTNVRFSKSSLIADPNRAVKCFQRSAAGKDLCNPNSLRPPDVLLKTVRYLLTDVVMDNRLPWNEVYDFICDRLRAVRQDLIIQQPAIKDSISILEPIIRFHIYAAYRLCDSPISEFDPKLNNDHTLECLKQILVLYDWIDTDDNIGTNNYCKSRSEMETLYQIINLGTTDALLRGLKLPENIMTDELRTVIRLSLAWYCNHYIIIFKRIKTLSPLLQAALSSKLSTIRRFVLQSMSVAYNSKNSQYPLNHLTKLLLYDSEIIAEEECIYYNLTISNRHVKFLKNSFDSSKQAVGRKVNFVTNTLNSLDLPNLLLNNIINED